MTGAHFTGDFVPMEIELSTNVREVSQCSAQRITI